MTIRVAKRDIKPNVAALIEKTIGVQRGAVLLHSEIAAMSGIEYNSEYWPVVIQRWKRHYAELGRWISSVHGVGYKFCTVDEQIKIEAERLKRQGERRFRKAAVCAGRIDKNELPADLRVLQDVSVQQSDGMAATAKVERVRFQSYVLNPQLLPRNGQRGY